MAPAKEPRRLTHQDVEDLTTDLHEQADPTAAHLLAWDAVNGMTGLCEFCDERTSYHLLISRETTDEDLCVYCVTNGEADEEDDTFSLSELWDDDLFKHRIGTDQACCDRHALNADHEGPCAAWLDSDDSDDGCEVVE